LRIFYRVLLVAAALILLLLMGGTIYALCFRRAPNVEAPSTQSQPGAGTAAASTFTGLGTIRALTGDSPPATVILSIAFPYSPEDRAFAEELAARIAGFRDLTREYFASLSGPELRSAGEAELKEGLLKKFNGILTLGRIGELYFYDYLVID
jgi:flagellar basal body-associated protein FliL